MAIYKISELVNKLGEILNDGYEYVDIVSFEADDDIPESLSFEAVECESGGVSYEEVESCELPGNYDINNPHCSSIKVENFCGDILFTYHEIFVLSHAVDNALGYFKDCLKDPAHKDLVPEIKQSSIECRNLQAKFAKFLKTLKPNHS